MLKMNRVAAGVGATFALGYASMAAADLPDPGALGNAFLHFTNFQFVEGNNAKGTAVGAKSITSVAGFTGLSGTEIATSSSCLNGTCTPTDSTTTGLGVGFTSLNTGPLGSTGFAPSATNTSPFTTANPTAAQMGYGSAAFSQSAGNSTTGSAEVYLHSISQLGAGGLTNAAGTQDVSANFQISVGSTVTVELAFDLERFIRAALGPQSQFQAKGGTLFSVTVTKIGQDDDVYNWAPNGAGGLSGTCVGAGDCTVFSDPFTIQNSRTTNAGEFADKIVDHMGLASGHFESELTLDAGTYDFSINSSATTNAAILLPEPGTVALLGLGLLGLGASVTRRRHHQE